MRFSTRVSCIGVTALLGAAMTFVVPLHAQVSDAERAAARDLFKQGDELAREGKVGDALDKFQRAQHIYGAPTNVLRIAQCQAGLGQLVESAESYRAVARTTLPAGSPPAFVAAVEQAKTELAQLEPRVPRLIVRVTPSNAPVQMQIDGQSVSDALVGEPIPLDPGAHHLRITATTLATFEADTVLKERETTTVTAVLRPAPLAASTPLLEPLPPPPAVSRSAPRGSAIPALPPSASSAPTTAPPVGAPPPYAIAPPPPPISDRQVAPAYKPSRTGLLLGAHVGWEGVAGKVPVGSTTSAEANSIASGGVAYALDGGLRFARNGYVGLTLEHANFSHGDLSSLTGSLAGTTDVTSSTTLLAAVIGFVANPDRTSLYGEVGVGVRWFTFTATSPSVPPPTSYSNAELELGLGVWLPVGTSLRIVPKLALGLGGFDDPSGGSNAQAHTFAMLCVGGYYNLDF